MDENKAQEWYESRTNIAAMVLMASGLSAVYGGKLAGMSPEIREALVTVLLIVLPPVIIKLRNIAKKVIR
jgi:hypothetical protein